MMKRIWNLIFKPMESERDPKYVSSVDRLALPPGEAASLPEPPVLYFAGGGIDEREVIYHKLRFPYAVIGPGGTRDLILHHSQHPKVQAVTVKGSSLVVRQMDRHVLFREPHRPVAEDALFLPNTVISQFADIYGSRTMSGYLTSALTDMDKVMGGRNTRFDSMPGRCIMYTPRNVDQGLCNYLFFQRNGEGFALILELEDDVHGANAAIKYEQINFPYVDVCTIEDVLSLPVADLRPFCDRLYVERIKPPGIPLSWQRGSEEELRRLTRAICHTEPGLFDSQQIVTVVYNATTPWKRGGFRHVCRKQERLTSRRLMSLCEFAFRMNLCIGMQWIPVGYNCYLQKTAEHIKVTVEPPSAHDRADAYLTLVDWLEDKWHDTEKYARFGLSPRL